MRSQKKFRKFMDNVPTLAIGLVLSAIVYFGTRQAPYDDKELREMITALANEQGIALTKRPAEPARPAQWEAYKVSSGGTLYYWSSTTKP
jgi:hypothetical protein